MPTGQTFMIPNLAGNCPCFFLGFFTELQRREQTLPFRLLSFSYFNILPIRHFVINEYDKASLSTTNKQTRLTIGI